MYVYVILHIYHNTYMSPLDTTQHYMLPTHVFKICKIHNVCHHSYTMSCYVSFAHLSYLSFVFLSFRL